MRSPSPISPYMIGRTRSWKLLAGGLRTSKSGLCAANTPPCCLTFPASFPALAQPSQRTKNQKMASTQEEGEQISPQRQLALGWSEEDILSVFEHTPPFRPSGSSVTGFPFPPQQPAAWVKFGWPSILKPEVRNHEYAFTALREMPADQTRGVHIPEIYRTFESGTNFFIVMEYIPGKTLRQLLKEPGGKSAWESLTNKIANGIRLLMSIPAPPGQTPGPVGGGLIRHSLFKHETSYCEYSSVDELEDHLNKVRNYGWPPFTIEPQIWPPLTKVLRRCPPSEIRMPQP